VVSAASTSERIASASDGIGDCVRRHDSMRARHSGVTRTRTASVFVMRTDILAIGVIDKPRLAAYCANGVSSKGSSMATSKGLSIELCKSIPDFWGKIDKSGDCWFYHGKNDRTYSSVVVTLSRGKYRSTMAHCIAVVLSGGVSIQPGQVVRHMCHNPSCCNPSHLKIGTQQENCQDTADRIWAENEARWAKTREEIARRYQP
jgi:hypothetical protein